jgi:hypothetical protein
VLEVVDVLDLVVWSKTWIKHLHSTSTTSLHSARAVPASGTASASIESAAPRDAAMVGGLCGRADQGKPKGHHHRFGKAGRRIRPHSQAAALGWLIEATERAACHFPGPA